MRTFASYPRRPLHAHIGAVIEVACSLPLASVEAGTSAGAPTCAACPAVQALRCPSDSERFICSVCALVRQISLQRDFRREPPQERRTDDPRVRTRWMRGSRSDCTGRPAASSFCSSPWLLAAVRPSRGRWSSRHQATKRPSDSPAGHTRRIARYAQRLRVSSQPVIV